MRLSLHVKLMLSYLLVAGLVFVPNFFFVRTTQQRELHDNVVRDLRSELVVLARHLASTPPDRYDADVAQLLRLSSRRLTIIDPSGRVLGDSEVTGRELENHGNRPEVRQALDGPDGFGTATRHSDTVGYELVYCAMRYPTAGPPRGVVRLAVPTAALAEMETRASTFLYRAYALAMSAAVLLSLVAAIVVSRPLRRIAEGARAFAAGDFGRSFGTFAQDELGDVARALVELASQLRERLVSLGADRATLRAVIDELPVGVIIYGDDEVIVGASARSLCLFDTASELTQAQALLALEGHAELVRQVLADGVTRAAPLELPWAPKVRRHARWVATYSAAGAPRAALIVSDLDDAVDVAGIAEQMDRAVGDLRRIGARLTDPDRADAIRSVAERLVEARPPMASPRAEDVRHVPFGVLFASAAADLPTIARGKRIECSVSESDIEVIDANGRVHAALRALLKVALDRCETSLVAVQGEVTERSIRLEFDCPVDQDLIDRVAGGVRMLGGDAGSSRDDDVSTAWLTVPRA